MKMLLLASLWIPKTISNRRETCFQFLKHFHKKNKKHKNRCLSLSPRFRLCFNFHACLSLFLWSLSFWQSQWILWDCLCSKSDDEDYNDIDVVIAKHHFTLQMYVILLIKLRMLNMLWLSHNKSLYEMASRSHFPLVGHKIDAPKWNVWMELCVHRWALYSLP